MLARKLTAASARAAAAPWWRAGGAPEPVAVYQPIGAASLAASYVNLANPGVFDAAPGVAPTLGAAGWGSDGTKWLNTGIVPSSRDWSYLVRFSDAETQTLRLFGSNVSGATLYIEPLAGGAFTQYANHGSGLPTNVSGTTASGVLAIANTTLYKNGAAVGVLAGGDFTATPLEIYIMAMNSAGSASRPGVVNIQAIAIYDTSTDHAIWVPAVSAAMAALT